MKKLHKFIKKNIVLIIVILTMLLLIGLFHEIMTPFVIAIIVVYLIDPMVTRMNKLKIRKRHIPRGLAVICAYLVFLLALTGIGFAFIPSLTAEISRASEQLPQYLVKVKDEDLPRWSQRVDELIFRFSLKNTADIQKSVGQSSADLNKAFDKALDDINEITLPDVDTSGQKPLLIAGDRKARTPKHAENAETHNAATPTPVILTLHPKGNGDFELIPGDQELIFEPTSNGAYTLKPAPVVTKTQASANSFNLEREVGKAVIGFVESSTQYAGSALSLLQNAIQLIVNTFVQFILVFMLAAFISIDSPNIMKHIRNIFANDDGEAKGYDEFKARLTKGLSGVVRGQLIICCIDGTLTGIGLAIFGVDFALLLGIIAGILSIVPIFGTIISTIPAVLLGLVQGPMTALIVLAWILVVHAIDTNFFTPKIVGSSSNLHPVVIIFALLAGQQFAGVLGLILAVPTASMLQTLITFVIERAKRDELEENKALRAAETSVEAAETLVEAAETLVEAAEEEVSETTKADEVDAPSQSAQNSTNSSGKDAGATKDTDSPAEK